MTRRALAFLALLAAACPGPTPPTTDGGQVPLDGGESEFDAGSSIDSGSVTADAGSDAGSGLDAGTGGDGGLTLAARRAAAEATVHNNALCKAIEPFYWELGDQTGALASGTIADAGETLYDADTVLHIASASKWFYSTYWVQRTKGVLSAEDIKFFNFWSGYTDFTNCKTGKTVAECLDVSNLNGTTNGQFEPTTENKFDYGGGHMQKHAALNGLGAMDNTALAAEIQTQIGTDIAMKYGEPQLAGGGVISANTYAKLLRKIIGGQLVMKSVLGTHVVCTNPASCPSAISSPSPAGEQWGYSIGHWVESDPLVGDGAFSSAGAFGFYPWIDATKTLYGIVAREDKGRAGFESAKCGRLIRKAWVTGVEQ